MFFCFVKAYVVSHMTAWSEVEAIAPDIQKTNARQAGLLKKEQTKERHSLLLVYFLQLDYLANLVMNVYLFLQQCIWLHLIRPLQKLLLNKSPCLRSPPIMMWNFRPCVLWFWMLHMLSEYHRLCSVHFCIQCCCSPYALLWASLVSCAICCKY